jgi:thiamine-monophosphate kinase
MAKDPQPPDEFALIAKYFAPLAAPEAFGLTDDAAIIRPRPDQDLVVKTDGLVAGVHFFPDDPPGMIAQKLLRVNLSDLAAKGAVPHGYVLTAAFPKDVTETWLAGFVAGLAADQAAFGVRLLGGDTMATPGPLTLSLTAFGHVREGGMVRRQGAQPGDEIYVTGTIGDAGLGLALLKGEDLGLGAEERSFLVERYRLPRPRTGLGPALPGLVHAGLDVSDGLVADLGHMAKVSSVRVVLTLGAVPLSAPAVIWVGTDASRRLRLATAGDDYEIVLAVPPEGAPHLAAAAASAGTPITRIGRIEAGVGVSVVGPDGAVLPVAQGGYRHF